MPAINPLPTPPSRNDPANFSDRADAFLAALPAYTSEANALLDDVHTSRDTVQTLRNEVIAAGLESAAANAATAATKAAEAASSASEAFGYLQTYRATSYGALANDPVVDPNGNPPTVGDEYFNTTMNLLKRFNGVTWQASDIATAILAEPGGSALIGYDDGTAQDVLDNAKPMANYTALRAYTGRATGVRITQTGLAGIFQRDAGDTTSADNGGTIIVDASGRRWKRIYSGLPDIRWFGAILGQDNTAAIQATLNAGAMWIPDGEWELSTATVTRPGTIIEGESKNAILKRKALTYKPLIVADGKNDVIATRFKVDGNKAGSPLTGSWTPSGGGADIAENEQGDIVCRNGSNAMIENVSFVNSLTSPALLYKMTSSNIIGCNSYGHQREGFYIISGRGNRIARCDSRGDAVQPWSLIATTGLSTDADPHDHIVEDNYCYDSQAAFVTINTTYTKIRHNVIGKLQGLASTGPGIRLGHDLPGQSAGFADVHNNRVFGVADSGSGGTGRGISIENAPGADVNQNIVNGCRVGVGSSLTHNLGVTVRDNIADSCTVAGFDIYYSMNPRVLRNVSRSCPTGFSLSCQGMYAADNYAIGSATWGFSVVGTSGLNSANTFENNRTDSTTTNKWNVPSPGGQTFINNEYGANVQALPTISGSVPDVAAGNAFVVANASATNMTSLSNWKEGAIYTLFFNDSNTTLKQSGGSFRLKGSVDVTPSVAKIIQVLASGSLFYEVSRSF